MPTSFRKPAKCRPVICKTLKEVPMVFRSLMTPHQSYARLDDPFLAVQNVLRNLDNAWSNETPAMGVRLDVQEDEKAYLVTADLPGLAESEVEVTFEDG